MTSNNYIPSYASVRKHITEAKHSYHLLGVHRSSTQQEITAARRRLAMQVHPDVNSAPDAHTLMARVNVAYSDVTMSPEKYLATIRGRTCTTCHGNGCMTKQRGFTQTTKVACVSCHGSGKS